MHGRGVSHPPAPTSRPPSRACTRITWGGAATLRLHGRYNTTECNVLWARRTAQLKIAPKGSADEGGVNGGATCGGLGHCGAGCWQWSRGWDGGE